MRAERPTCLAPGSARLRGDERRLSLRLDVGGADDLAPLLALGFDVRPECRGREHQRGDAELAELRFDGWIIQPRVDLAAQSLDYVRWRVPRHARPVPGARGVVRDGLADGRHI